MGRIWRRRPSPAMVVACAALAVALGGTSYATALQIPRSSVGTVQLKNNAVTSAKVKDRSLLSADFKPGQIPVGPTGPAGAAGPAGAVGPTGPSDAFARVVNGPVATSPAFQTVANLSIPQAGRYVIWAKAGGLSNNTTGQLTCLLVDGNLQLDEAATPINPPRTSGVALVAAREFATAGSVDLRCAGGGSIVAVHIRVVAIRVGSLTST